MRGVMLDESSDGGRNDLPTVGLLFRSGLMAAQGLGPIDDRRDRHFEVKLQQALLDSRVVEPGDREIRIVDKTLLFKQEPPDQLLGISRQSSMRLSMIGQGVGLRVFAVLLEYGKEPCFADLEDLLDLRALHGTLLIAAEQLSDLVISKTPVNLGHEVLLGEDYSSEVHFSALNCSPFNLKQHHEYIILTN